MNFLLTIVTMLCSSEGLENTKRLVANDKAVFLCPHKICEWDEESRISNKLPSNFVCSSESHSPHKKRVYLKNTKTMKTPKALGFTAFRSEGSTPRQRQVRFLLPEEEYFSIEYHCKKHLLNPSAVARLLLPVSLTLTDSQWLAYVRRAANMKTTNYSVEFCNAPNPFQFENLK